MASSFLLPAMDLGFAHFSLQEVLQQVAEMDAKVALQKVAQRQVEEMLRKVAQLDAEVGQLTYSFRPPPGLEDYVPEFLGTRSNSSVSECSTAASVISPADGCKNGRRGAKRSCGGMFKATYRLPKLLEEFGFVRRFIGQSGSNTKSIAEACSGKVRLRGRGSGYLEGGGREANISLQVVISCNSSVDFETGDALLIKLLDRIAAEYKEFCLAHSLKFPSRFYFRKEDRLP